MAAGGSGMIVAAVEAVAQQILQQLAASSLGESSRGSLYNGPSVVGTRPHCASPVKGAATACVCSSPAKRRLAGNVVKLTMKVPDVWVRSHYVQ